MKRGGPAIALLAAVCVMAALTDCASPAAKSPNPKPAATMTTSTPLPGDQIAAHSFIDKQQGWAVGTDVGLGSLVLHTTDAGKHWRVLLRDDNDFPLVGVSFVDALHGWAVSSSGTLVGSILATRDGGRTWVEQFGAGPMESVDFTDSLHGTVEGWDGDSPNQKPITLTTSDGGKHWVIRPKK
jgi:hypothetical protein